MISVNNPVNSKIYFELLPESEQPQKTIFAPDMDTLKLCKVLKKGNKVSSFVNEGDILTLYVNSISMIDKKNGICSERDVIFCNKYPQEGKVHITHQEKMDLSSFSKVKVIKSSSEDIFDEEEIYYKKGQSYELPDKTEIISESQIYFK